MNPIMECLADLLLWDSHPDQMRQRRDELLKDFESPVNLAGGMAGPYRGLLTLMLFDEGEWYDALARIAEIEPPRWRDVILPAGAGSEKVLKALSSAEMAGELLASGGFVVDEEAAATYAAWLSNPRALKLRVIELLDEAWRKGFGAWWDRESASHRGLLKQSNMQVHQEYFVRVPLLAMARGEVEISRGDLSILLVPAINQIATTEATPREQTISVSIEETGLVECLAALADPTRLGILRILAGGPSYPTILAKTLGLSGPSMSHHILSLKHAGLIRTTRSGSFTRVELRRETYLSVLASLQGVILGGQGERN